MVAPGTALTFFTKEQEKVPVHSALGPRRLSVGQQMGLVKSEGFGMSSGAGAGGLTTGLASATI